MFDGLPSREAGYRDASPMRRTDGDFANDIDEENAGDIDEQNAGDIDKENAGDIDSDHNSLSDNTVNGVLKPRQRARKSTVRKHITQSFFR
jgi:hypothetical protein